MQVEDATYTEREWKTEAGFNAMVIVCRGSHRCGYIQIPEGHPLFQLNYSNPTYFLDSITEESTAGERSPVLVLSMAIATQYEEVGYAYATMEYCFDVHGGITFASQHPTLDRDEWWIGFDCAHYNDLSMIPSRNFVGSQATLKTLEFCIDQCENLAKQVANQTILLEY